MDTLSPPIARQDLLLHGFHGEPGAIRVTLERRRGRLDFSFCVDAVGAVPLVLPAMKAAPERRDELWRQTCFELFLAPLDQPGYLELNLAPSGDWNLYAFDDYRSGMRPVTLPVAPLLSHEAEFHWRGHLLLQGSTTEGDIDILGAAVLEVGVAAVLAYEDGTHEYRALAHAPDRPDFHLRQTFLARL